MELFFEGLNCANCASKIERKVSNLDGVREAAMNFMAQTMVIDIEDESMRDAIKDIIVDITHQLEPDVVVKEVTSSAKGNVPSEVVENDDAQGRGRCELYHWSQRDAGLGGRIWLRQDHGGAHAAAPV